MLLYRSSLLCLGNPSGKSSTIGESHGPSSRRPRPNIFTTTYIKATHEHRTCAQIAHSDNVPAAAGESCGCRRLAALDPVGGQVAVMFTHLDRPPYRHRCTCSRRPGKVLMSRPPSPRPAEPDTHLRVITGGLVVDFCGCRTAVRNFLHDWLSRPHPSITASEIRDGFLPYRRMPCEALWLDP